MIVANVVQDAAPPIGDSTLQRTACDAHAAWEGAYGVIRRTRRAARLVARARRWEQGGGFHHQGCTRVFSLGGRVQSASVQ